jgi:dihydrofolate reductase
VIISLIVATDERGGIGKDNRLPWHLSSDLKRFKQLTMGHHIVMGRKTYETIGKPLPGRVMMIVTRNENYSPQGCSVVNSLNAAIDHAKNSHESELFIIGGGEIFNQAIRIAGKIYLTTIHTDANADVFFPEINSDEWVQINYEAYKRNEDDDYDSDFKILQRIDKL